MKIRALSTAFAVALVLAAPASAQSKLKPVKIVDGVWAAQPEKGANVGWFLLGDGVVAVDAGADAANGADILKAIAETTGGKPVRALILTHAHADHSGGARAFAAAGARIVCQEGVAGQILAFVTQATSDPNDPMSGKTSLRPVVESISERAISVDGLHNVQVYFLGAAHTKGDLVIYLANDKVLFSGDIALNGRMPFLQSPDVDPAGWEKALLTLSKVPAEKLVPGHGDIGSKEGIADSLAYLHAVNQLARKFVDNAMRDDMMDAQIRAPENEVKNIPVTDAHIANVKAAVRAMREKAAQAHAHADSRSEVNPAGGIALARAAGGARADLRIARPPVNVLDAQSLHALARQVRAAGDARLLVLTGLAAAFSAGVDVAEHAPEPTAIDAMLAAMRDALEALVDSPAVTLAAGAGACLGGGAEILAACDLVLLADDARVGFPEIRLACFPPGAAVLLPGLVGQARATDWILSGRILSGREAADAGFAARAVPAARLDVETERLAGRVLAASPRALAAARDLLRGRRREALANGLAAAEDAYRGLAGSEDLAKAVRDFGARRR